MACNSVATSKATLSKIILDQSGLTAMIQKITGSNAEVSHYHLDVGDKARNHSGRTIKLRNAYDTVSIYVDGYEVKIQQKIDDDGAASLTMYCDTQALQDRLLPVFERQTIVAQQSAVLRKLAQLGKLSNVAQKDSGVTARIVLEIK